MLAGLRVCQMGVLRWLVFSPLKLALTGVAQDAYRVLDCRAFFHWDVIVAVTKHTFRM